MEIPDVRLRRLVDRLSSKPELRREPEPREGYTEAAVAVILRASTELEVLLIKRAESERDPWSGHVALPGGRRDAKDSDLTQTSIRETAEETGVELSSSGWSLGRLGRVVPSHPTLPPITITPYVFGVPETIEANANSAEVDQVLWVTLPENSEGEAPDRVAVDPIAREIRRAFWQEDVRGSSGFGIEQNGQCDP